LKLTDIDETGSISNVTNCQSLKNEANYRQVDLHSNFICFVCH